MKKSIVDGFVKSPTSALRFIPRHCGVRPSTPHSSEFARLEFEAFYFAIKNRLFTSSSIDCSSKKTNIFLKSPFEKGDSGVFKKSSIFLTAITLVVFLFSGCSTWGSRPAPDSLLSPRVESVAGILSGNSSEESAPEPELPEMTAPELEHLGDIAFSRKDLPTAYINYDKCLLKDPENTRVLYKKGLVLLAGNMDTEAIAVFEAILAREPGYAPAREGLGRAFFKKKEYARAEAELKKAIGLDPALWQAHNFLGMLYDRKKKHDLAATEYESAIAANPRQGFLYNNFGVCLLMTGKNEQAVTAFEKAIENGLTGNRIYNNLGMALARSGEYEKALDAFKRAGGTSKAYNNLGCVNLAEGNYRNAVANFEKALGSSPEFYETADENLKQAKGALARAEGKSLHE